MTTNSKNLREYADSARRAYSALARNVNVADIDMYLTERSTYLAEYKLALTEAYELARAEVLGMVLAAPTPPLAPGTHQVLS